MKMLGTCTVDALAALKRLLRRLPGILTQGLRPSKLMRLTISRKSE
ncbi:MAG: hypothetical protein KTR33_03400 [Gammaproteobacteria bacterium]|nr:hypothetical protein [Gammaproteobacteria bacterium]